MKIVNINLNTLSNQLLAASQFPVGAVRDDENAEDYDADLIARGKLIDTFIEACFDEDPETFVLNQHGTAEGWGSIKEVTNHFFLWCVNAASQQYMK